MTFGGVFWYGAVILVLSFIAGYGGGGDVASGLFTVAVNWLFFVLPVIVIRNIRRSRKAPHATS